MSSDLGYGDDPTIKEMIRDNPVFSVLFFLFVAGAFTVAVLAGLGKFDRHSYSNERPPMEVDSCKTETKCPKCEKPSPTNDKEKEENDDDDMFIVPIPGMGFGF